MKTAALVLVAALSVAPARAEEKPAAKAAFSFGGFFKNLKESLEKSAIAGERKKGRGAAVAAVRGAGQKSELADPNEPTLKGDSRSKRMAKQAAEDDELLKATVLAEQGKTTEALAAFQTFQKAHPKSHKEDVEKAISELQKAVGGEAAVGETKAE